LGNCQAPVYLLYDGVKISPGGSTMIRGRVLASFAGAVTLLLLAACAPPPPPPPPPAPIVPGPQSISEKTLMTMAADLSFAPGGYTLRPAGKKELDGLVPALQAMGPKDKVVVYGYTDNRPVGKALTSKGIVDNLDLSSKRANEVVRYLTSKGVNPAAISAK